MSSHALKDWYDRTSIGGLSNARDSKTKGLKICWFTIFILGIVITVYQVWSVFQSYFQYPVTTTVTIDHASALMFPAVAFCNVNRIHCQRLQDVIANREKKDTCKVSSDSPGCELTVLRQILEATLCNYTVMQLAAMAQNLSTLNVHHDDNIDVSASKENKFLNMYTRLERETRIEIGHQFEDFIKECSFKSYNCLNTSIFKIENNPRYGNCFVFNHANNPNDIYSGKRNVSITGNFYGLQVVLNIEQDQYMRESLTQSLGARVAIFDPFVDLLIDEFGLDVAPATKASIAMMLHRTARLPHPYTSNCTTNWNSTAYTTDEHFNYTLLKCQRYCLQETVQQMCNCFLPAYLNDMVSTINTTTPCHMTSNGTDSLKQEYNCVNNVYNDFDNGRKICYNCTVPCKEHDYDVTVTYVGWPSDVYMPLAYLNYYGTTMDVSQGSSEAEHFRNNLIKVEVFFETLNIINTEEEKTYTFETLLSDLGGAFSLMLGISLAMLFEFFQLIVSICIDIFGSQRKRKTLKMQN